MHNKLIRFTATWCADCIVMRPRWVASFKKLDNLQVVDYDLDDHENEAQHFGVTHVPVLLVVDESGKEVARLTGMNDGEVVDNFLDKHCSQK